MLFVPSPLDFGLLPGQERRLIRSGGFEHVLGVIGVMYSADIVQLPLRGKSTNQYKVLLMYHHYALLKHCYPVGIVLQDMMDDRICEKCWMWCKSYYMAFAVTRSQPI